jgi:very-short-patch-repair endonuclease
VLAGLTAAIRCGLKGFRSDGIHLVRPARLRSMSPPRGVVVHRSGTLSDDDVKRRALPPHTTNARSLVDAAAWAGTDDQARAIIAAGFQQRLVGADDIHQVAYRLPTLRRRSLILATANDARGGSESLPELRYLHAARRAGLPEPTRQHRRRDSSGRVRYLDVYYERWRVHVEIDGGQHLDVRQQWADMARQNDVWISGDRVLRFPAWLVRDRPAEVIAQVRQALRSAGWQG